MSLYGAGELHVALVTSSKANARLVSVDASAALVMPGVVGFLDHTSVPGSNLTGESKVEEIFATTEVCILPAELMIRTGKDSRLTSLICILTDEDIRLR